MPMPHYFRYHIQKKIHIIPSFTEDSCTDFMSTAHIYGWDYMLVPYSTKNVTSWLATNLIILPLLNKHCPGFIKYTLWIPAKYYGTSIFPACDHPGWAYCTHSYNTLNFGDGVAAFRVGIAIIRVLYNDSLVRSKYSSADCDNPMQLGYSHCVRQDLNKCDEIHSIPLPIGILDHSDCNRYIHATTPLTVAMVHDILPIPSKSYILCTHVRNTVIQVL